MRLRRFRLEAADFEIYVERLGHYGIWGSLAEQLGKGEQFARHHLTPADRAGTGGVEAASRR